MAVTTRKLLLFLALASCILAGSYPAAAHPRKLQQHRQPAAGTAESDTAAEELLATASYTPPAIPAEEEAELAVAAAAAADAPPGRRSCATNEGSRGHRAANERRFQQRLQQLRARGEDVAVAHAPVITVYFHVLLFNKTKGWVTREQIHNQIATLNAAYSGVFSFSLADAIWYTTSDTTLFNADINSPGEMSIKQRLRKGSARTLNIYTWEPKDSSSGGTTLGWATFPWQYSSSPKTDGVVLLHSTINGGTYKGYNLGDTAVHEVGHWAGLYHTFEGGCGSADTASSGDFVSDTPAVKVENFECKRTDSCPLDKQGPDLIENFMDYTPDACMNSFTPGQRARMQSARAIYRSRK